VRHTSLCSSILGSILTYTAVDIMKAEAFGGAAYVPSFLHPGERPHLYRGVGSKAVKTRSKREPVLLSPLPYRGIKPPGGLVLKGRYENPRRWKGYPLTTGGLQAKGDPFSHCHGPTGALSPLGVSVEGKV
jgi:hypothetical protein